MTHRLSALLITHNNEKLFSRCLQSVINLADEVIVIDNLSTDRTAATAARFGATFISHKEEDLGRQRAFGLKKVHNDWVLMLDPDEVVSTELKSELRRLLKKKTIRENGFFIPYQNHFLGRKIRFGGENYKIIRLFRKSKAVVEPSLIHEKVTVREGEIGQLNGHLLHFSYRGLRQVFAKFTGYATRLARQKNAQGERSSLWKMTAYPIHMFWSRFVSSHGYRDGFFRLPLDAAFAYLEFLTYFLLFFQPKKKQ
ncbi:glycosyltransferase family 2 protein [Candidatus Roizmanbacteria bacterium]|nr:glycosyltransferase family 2 protein [Candidatus Roizmanbacteria bacterium]